MVSPAVVGAPTGGADTQIHVRVGVLDSIIVSNTNTWQYSITYCHGAGSRHSERKTLSTTALRT